jgi:hypothetical protein
MLFKSPKRDPELDAVTQAWRQTLEAWAAKRGYQAKLIDSRHVRVSGNVGDAVWQLHAGRPSRPYLKGVEIKVGVKAAQDFNSHGVVCTRRVAELIRETVYGEVTEDVNTHANKDWPEEMIWVTTLREHALTAPWGEYLACYGSPAGVVGAYAGQFLAALPGGESAAALNSVLPWLLALKHGTFSLRTAQPVLDLEGLETALQMTHAALKPLRLLTLKPE